MRVVITLDEEIKDFEKMDAVRREEAVDEAIGKMLYIIGDHFEVIGLLPENSRCNQLVLDTINDYIITRLV